VFGALAVGQTAPAPANPSGNSAAIFEVKAYCSTIDDYKKDANPQLFADASDQPKPMWRRVGTERELESLTEAQFQHSVTAKVWLKDGKVVAVETESASSGTGDWGLSVEYCFRPDGTLAALHSEFRNETDEYIAIRDERYDADGTQLSDDAQFLDERSRRPKKLSKQQTAAEVRAPLYKTAKELPFMRLVSTH
jgi:hypothetical protein